MSAEPEPGKRLPAAPAALPSDAAGTEGPWTGGPRPGSLRREGYFPRGAEPWTSLDAFAEGIAATPDMEAEMRAGYPPPADAAPDWSRRNFLRLMGASLALAGVTGCGRGVGLPGGRSRLLPYARAPEGLIPGRPRYYATSLVAAGEVLGALGETHMGRPTKLEGNPDHPASLGATDAFAQAAVLEIYDPARARLASEGGLPREAMAFRDFLLERRAGLLPRQGDGLRILTGEIRSPSLLAQITGLLAEMPGARWHAFEPVGTANAKRGAELAFGRGLGTVAHLDRADTVVSLGADPFGWGPGRVRNLRDWSQRRKLRAIPAGEAGMCRWYVAESHPSQAGAAADHRLRVPPSRLPMLARALFAKLEEGASPDRGLTAGEREWMLAAAADLRAARGRGLILAGEALPPEAHALVHRMNGSLGNIGGTVTYVEPMEGEAAASGLRDLAEAMHAGEVDTLLILDANPAYAAPRETDWAGALAKVPHSACVSFYRDETAVGCRWHAPLAHDLETWGDLRSCDGTISLQQPLLEPFAPAWTPAMAIAALRGNADPDPRALLEGYWRPRLGEGFETRWREALRKGVLAPGEAAEPPSLPRPTESASSVDPLSVDPLSGDGLPDDPGSPDEVGPPAGLEVEFRPDPAIWDGRYAFNPWLQETPKPFSQLVWDNAVYLSPATAGALGLRSRDEVELGFRGRSVSAPVWILPGQCDGVATLHLGYGRAWPGPRVWLEGDGALASPAESRGETFGFDAYALRTGDALWHGRGLSIRKTGKTRPLACRQEQERMEGRSIVRAADLARLKEDPAFCAEPERESLYPERRYEGYAWGMSIDMSLCTGCQACTVACRAENNVPVVGKEGVLRHRDMAWLRIDRYFTGPSDAPAAYFQPMLCQHCEHAPCEVVCPVEATAHDSEGLNQMIYNRCIGTRYCSNNCPYKVRRFNFFDYARAQDAAAAPQRNPDVTVRGRGVMEKCTFCVQRIAEARIGAEKGNRRIRDGEAVTACMQACPTGAIVFGDLNDPASRVAGERKTPWNFAVLGELNTRPRVRYLAKVWNQNPGLPQDPGKGRV